MLASPSDDCTPYNFQSGNSYTQDTVLHIPCKMFYMVHIALCKMFYMVHIALCKMFYMVHIAPCKMFYMVHIAPCKMLYMVHIAPCKMLYMVHIALNIVKIHPEKSISEPSYIKQNFIRYNTILIHLDPNGYRVVVKSTGEVIIFHI